ncbi:MAG: DUF58 domain-containing protein [Candidatus Methylomirabilales bacterium]
MTLPAANISYDPAFLQKLERLTIVIRRVLGGRVRGERPSRRRGAGVEFQDFRPYVAGDDIRYLDWNVYRRMERLVLKLFVEEQDLCLHVLVDSSASMGFGQPTKLVYAAQAAAAIGYVALASHERVAAGLIGWGDSLAFRPTRGKRRIFALLEFLEKGRAAGQTDLTAALADYARRTRATDLVVLLSDLLDPQGFEGGVDALLARGVDVVLLHLITEAEEEPPLAGDYRLEDAETAEHCDVTVDPDTLDRYRQNRDAFFGRCEEFCRRRGVDYLRVRTDLPLEDLILRDLCAGGILR